MSVGYVQSVEICESADDRWAELNIDVEKRWLRDRLNDP